MAPARTRTKMKRILIFYTPGAYGSFLAWMIERFNTARRAHNPPVIDNPLQANGSSHSYATLCKLSPMTEIIDFLEDDQVTPWGYRIWAGWPVTQSVSLDQAIDATLAAMGANDRLVVVSRDSEWEALLCWLNAGSKLEPSRWFSGLGIESPEQLTDALRAELASKSFKRLSDPRLLEISVNDIVFAPADQVLSLVSELGLEICDHKLFETIIAENRSLQTNIELLDDINSAESTPAVESIRKLNG
jgi:hypothetical protein